MKTVNFYHNKMKTVIDKSKPDGKTVERRVRAIMATVFMICFLISLGYWGYSIYEIYDTDIISFDTAGQVWHYAGRQFVAFEAAILSFMLFYASLKI